MRSAFKCRVYNNVIVIMCDPLSCIVTAVSPGRTQLNVGTRKWAEVHLLKPKAINVCACVRDVFVACERRRNMISAIPYVLGNTVWSNSAPHTSTEPSR